MPSHDDGLRLRHMLEAAKKAVAFAANRTRKDLDTDEQFALALTRLLEITKNTKGWGSYDPKNGSSTAPQFMPMLVNVVQ